MLYQLSYTIICRGCSYLIYKFILVLLSGLTILKANYDTNFLKQHAVSSCLAECSALCPFGRSLGLEHFSRLLMSAERHMLSLRFWWLCGDGSPGSPSFIPSWTAFIIRSIHHPFLPEGPEHFAVAFLYFPTSLFLAFRRSSFENRPSC